MQAQKTLPTEALVVGQAIDGGESQRVAFGILGLQSFYITFIQPPFFDG
jgi:hypothetical protein